AICSVPPRKLALFLDGDTPLGKARIEWMTAKEAYRLNPTAMRAEAADAAKTYVHAISKALKGDLKFSVSESFIKFVVGDFTSGARTAIAMGAGAALAVSTGSVVAGAGAYLATQATAYGVSLINSKMVGVVTEKYRVLRLTNELLNPALIRRSKQVVKLIKARRAPSAIIVDRAKAKVLAQGMIRFGS
ncbi:MAG: hypothetical protein H7X89_14010, partial [Rhizobiales bacterium]|nr:hypothetical protein [Hyphomicrobiales bacterium]